uniref:DNA damage regulated autophagy modulator 1 n=1 Tax=Lynx canadensis TaxID=61383 RepID=A0A667GPJ5_LYNCA
QQCVCLVIVPINISLQLPCFISCNSFSACQPELFLPEELEVCRQESTGYLWGICLRRSKLYSSEVPRALCPELELAVPLVHDGGALLAFVCGVVYTLLQSVISYKSCPQWNSLSTCHVRMAISAVSCAAVVPMIACASLISITKLEWNPKEKDYIYHVVSAICEWTVAFGFIFYFLTFIHDFQSVTLRISTEINDDI